MTNSLINTGREYETLKMFKVAVELDLPGLAGSPQWGRGVQGVEPLEGHGRSDTLQRVSDDLVTFYPTVPDTGNTFVPMSVKRRDQKTEAHDSAFIIQKGRFSKPNAPVQWLIN